MKSEIIAGVLIGAILSIIAGYFTVYSDIVELKSKVNGPSLAEKLKIHSGIIIPFYGNSEDAASLVRDGWVICDGRIIVDKKASPKLNGKKTPNLVNMFLMGSEKSGVFGGHAYNDTTSNGEHSHGIKKISGSGFGNDNPDDQFLTAPAGNHKHSVNVIPPYMSVIYLMYVR